MGLSEFHIIADGVLSNSAWRGRSREAGEPHYARLRVLALLLSALFPAGGHFFGERGLLAVLLLTILVLPAAHMFVYGASDVPGVLSVLRLGLDFVGVVYVSLPIATGMLIRYSFPNGTALLFVTMLANWNCDNGGLVFGKAFGRTRPFLKVSPNKTAEGVLGGWLFILLSYFLASGPVAALFPSWVFPPILTWPRIVVLATIQALGNIMGDLCESHVKRVGDVKHSGGFFPGHGGVLDKIDGMIWVIPSSYLFFLVIHALEP